MKDSEYAQYYWLGYSLKVPIGGRCIGELSLLEAWDWIVFYTELEKDSQRKMKKGLGGPPPSSPL